MDANGRLQGSKTKCLWQCLWPQCLSKLPRNILRVWGRANSRLERPNNRGPWTQTAGFKALRPNACGQSAWSKLPRNILRVWGRANARLERPNKRGPLPWRQTAGFKALRPNACGHSALSKLPRNILRVWGQANGRLERRNKRGPWMQKAGYKALRPNACGHSALRTVLGVWRPGNGTGSTPAVVPGAAPALRAPAFRLFSHPFETRFSFVLIVSLR